MYGFILFSVSLKEKGTNRQVEEGITVQGDGQASSKRGSAGRLQTCLTVPGT